MTDTKDFDVRVDLQGPSGLVNQHHIFRNEPWSKVHRVGHQFAILWGGLVECKFTIIPMDREVPAIDAETYLVGYFVADPDVKFIPKPGEDG